MKAPSEAVREERGMEVCNERNPKEAWYRLLFNQRWIMGYMGFLSQLIICCFRANMNIAIVCMVKSPIMEPNVTYSVNNDTDYRSTSQETTSVGHRDHVSCEEVKSGVYYDTGELEWNKNVQSWVLSSFYYGYIVTQIPGGWMAQRFGGKNVIGVAMIVSSIGCLVTPVLARASVMATIIIRAILGLCAGLTIPAWLAMIGVWSPIYERSRMAAFAMGGQASGTTLTYATSGILCTYGFDNGWGSIFYTHGTLGLIVVVLWQYFTASSPAEHPRITDTEKLYLEKQLPQNRNLDRKKTVPWLKILGSAPVWSVITCHTCCNWTYYVILTCLPLFQKDVLKFDVQSNGLFSSLPFVSNITGVLVSSYIADYVMSKGWLTPTVARRCLQIFALLASASFLVGTGFITCERRELAICFVCLGIFCLCFGDATGYTCTAVDIAPQYASVIFAISNTISTIPGMIAPMIVALVTVNGTSEEWRTIFYISTGSGLLGSLVYGIFSTSERQSWASSSCDIELTVDIMKSTTEETKSCGGNDFSGTTEGEENEKRTFLSNSSKDH